MTLTTIRKEAYQGKTLDDLQDRELNEELAGRTHGIGKLIISGYAVNIILTTEGAAEVTQEDIDVFSFYDSTLPDILIGQLMN